MLAEIARLEGIMLLLVLCGALLQKKQVIMPEGQSCLTDLLMDVILPSNIFLSLPKEMDWATMKNFLVAIVLSVAVMLGSTALGLLCYGRCPELEKKVFRYGLINSNALFIGLPVVQSLLGAPGVARARRADRDGGIFQRLSHGPVHAAHWGSALSHPLEGVSSAGCMGVRAAAAGRSARGGAAGVRPVPGALCGDGYLHTLVWYARSQPYGCAGRPIPGR